MDLELGNCDESEDICIKDEDCNIDSVFDQERCGICIDIVIDRGVLNCCDHWFCFACIDNWATITNLCPICRNEFQLITCLPVYDTIRSVTSEEHPLSRNEDWSIQGSNNALSFPSYYISEDAVKCLENDGCKIRSALHEMEEDLSFDTSIACDSCDVWYHAFCVGFNPEFTSENSWLCPRCANNEMLQKPGAISLQSLVEFSASQNSEVGSAVDPSLSGKVSVSVADAGETAVVVSMILGKQEIHCEDDRIDSNINIEIAQPLSYSINETSETAFQQKDGSCNQVPIFSDHKEQCTNASDIDSSSEIFFDLLPEIIDFRSYDDLKEAIVSSFSHDATIVKPRHDITELRSPPSIEHTSFSLCYSEANDEGKNINALEARFDSVFSNDYMDISSVALCASEVDDEPDKKSSHNTDTCLATSTSDFCRLKSNLGTTFSHFLAGDIVTSCNKDTVVDICHKSMETVNSAAEPNIDKACKINMDENNNCVRKREHEVVFPAKKPKLDGKYKTLPTGNQSTLSSLNGSNVFSRKNMAARLINANQKEAEAPDIMGIVQESDCITDIRVAGVKKNSTCGLRVKKIMRRVGDESESSILAQEIGKEIRKVVQNKALKEVGRNDIDEKLLAAFRAAMIRPRAELTSRSEHVHVGSKKSLLLKGKIRENLTKRIYGTSNGRRRHAWARDLEIEFWKHRCSKAQYEKVETLQSVLEVLKKATNPNWNSYTNRDSHDESTNSILSRVYIADASVLPRKDNIKPLSALSGSSHLDNHNLDKEKSLRFVADGPLNDNKSIKKNPIQISRSSVQLKANSCDSKCKHIYAAGFSGDTLNREANSAKAAPDKIPSSVLSCSKENLPNSKVHSCPSDAKSDKRKWALEVLARKTSPANMNANKDQEHGSLLKGNYPLLAQLPQDMRPVLASTPHNKISQSIRQAQLYRISEHYLRRADLAVIRRTAKTELAVADAVNVEKDIFERSNSKLVYVNLCSQAISQLANKRESAEPCISISSITANEAAESTKMASETDDNPESAEVDAAPGSTLPTLEMPNEASQERDSDHEAHGWSIIEKALKMAGLFSDSPPSSPYCVTKESNEDDRANENINESLNYDANGNAQHSMDKELNAPTTQESGKAVYHCTDVEDKVPCSFFNSLEQRTENGLENCDAEVRNENCLPTKIPYMGIFSSLSIEECEGAEKGPAMSRMFDDAVEVLTKSLVTGEEQISNSGSEEDSRVSVIDSRCCISDPFDGGTSHLGEISAEKEILETRSTEKLQIDTDNISEDIAEPGNRESDFMLSTSKKVEAYIKEHIRPLCKSGVITVEEYRCAVGKTLAKVMRFHHKAKNANFLIREGGSVKKLAEQYVKAAQKK